MDLSSAATRGKISEEERVARLLEGRCLYCGGVGHMACHCPNKSKNPFRVASAHMEGNPNTLANPNANTFEPTSSGGGGGGNRGGGGTGSQGQLGNA